jgi:hypothetical protein
MPEPTNLLGGSFSQIAYVTNDFAHGLVGLRERLGVTRFLELPDMAYMVRPDGGEAVCHIALAFSGGLQIELIEPRGGVDAIYRDSLPADGSYALQIHHVAQALPSLEGLETMRTAVAAQGWPLPVQGSHPNGITYFYADLRPLVGHYVEYTYSTPEFLAGLGAAIPTN